MYGVDLTQGDTEHYRLVQKLATIAEDISTPGRHVVEAFPIMQRLPSWFPGTGFRQLAVEWKQQIRAIRDKLYDAAKETMVCTGPVRSAVRAVLKSYGRRVAASRILLSHG